MPEQEKDDFIHCLAVIAGGPWRVKVRVLGVEYEVLGLYSTEEGGKQAGQLFARNKMEQVRRSHD